MTPEPATGAHAVQLPAAVVRVGRWLDRTSPWRVLAAVGVVRAAVCGITTAPSVSQWLAFARDPYGPIEIAPDFRYITGSPLGPLLAHTIGATSRTSYALLHLALVIAAAAALVGVGRRTVGDRLTTVLVVLLLASPLSNVLLTWLGLPDPVAVAGLSVIGLASAVGDRPRRTALVLVSSVLVGLASPEQGLVAVVTLGVLAWWGNRPGDREVILLAVGGLVAGRTGVSAFLAASDAPNVSRLDYIRRNGLGYFLRASFYNWAALAFSVFGAGWLLIGASFQRLRATFPNPWPVRAALLLVLVAVATTYDETRVSAIVTWPAAIWLLRRADEQGDNVLDPTLVAVTFLLALVVPPIVIWEGEPYVSSWLQITR